MVHLSHVTFCSSPVVFSFINAAPKNSGSSVRLKSRQARLYIETMTVFRLSKDFTAIQGAPNVCNWSGRRTRFELVINPSHYWRCSEHRSIVFYRVRQTSQNRFFGPSSAAINLDSVDATFYYYSVIAELSTNRSHGRFYCVVS